MASPVSPQRFAEVDAACRAALAEAARSLSRNERYAVEVILDLTYAAGFAQLAVTCMEDLSDALELGGRQNVNTLFRRLGNMQILRWDEATGSPSINPHPHTWLVRPSIPVSVERASRATAARARLLAHQRRTSAQGEFFHEPTAAEWEAQQAQERASQEMPSEASATPPPPEPARHNSYDADASGCHRSYDADASGCHRSYDADPGRCHKSYDVFSPHARAQHDHGHVAESNHDHDADAGEGTIAADLERFFVEGGISQETIAAFQRTWLRRIMDRPLKVKRCLDEAKAFRRAGGRPNKTWGHYLDHLYKLGQGADTGKRGSPADPSPPPSRPGPVKPQPVSDEERRRHQDLLRQARESLHRGMKTP